jgi:glycosyltransferase involved in cell wall biosynthesis
MLNTSERTGGAAVAANRLMQALNRAGHDAKMLVRDKQTDDSNVVSINTSWWEKKINFIRFAWERWVIFVHHRVGRKNLFAVSLANTGTDIRKHPLVKEADILHLHWINQGFLSLKNVRQLLKSGKPVVWTMHDMWCFTGGCHHAGSCRNYEEECRDCPVVKKNSTAKIARLFAEKRAVFPVAHFVGCSGWLVAAAKKSAVLRAAAVTAIPNPIAMELFQPVDKTAARKTLNLPLNRKLILFAAVKLSDARKGIYYFIEACRYLLTQETAAQTDIVFLGGKMEERLLLAIPLRTHVLGYLTTAADIAAAYAACDIFVTPSLEENLPNTIMEAMSCGLPCVGFRVGGIPEMIDHKVNGYVAEYKSAQDLAAGIGWCLMPENSAALSQQALLKVKKCYSENVVAKQYIDLYTRIIKKS